MSSYFPHLAVLLGSLGLGCAACQSQPPAHAAMPPDYSERFRLSATPGCADGYPAQLDEARFITPDGGSFPVPYGHFLTSSWEGAGIGWAVGNPMQPAPDSLELRWFSYTENKFYEGHFLLPHERLYGLLKRGFWQPESQTQGTYYDLVASVVPTGVVYVWLRGRLNRVFIGRYQAREIQYDYQRFQPGANQAEAMQEARAEMSPEARHQMDTGTLSSRQWDAYLRTYPWQLEFSRPLTLTRFGIDYVNAEALEDPPTPDMAAFAQVLLAPSPKPVPAGAGLVVSGPYGRQRRLHVTFDKAETMAAFESLHARHPQVPLTLHVEVNEALTQATLSLRASGQVLPLPHSKVESWPVN